MKRKHLTIFPCVLETVWSSLVFPSACPFLRKDCPLAAIVRCLYYLHFISLLYQKTRKNPFAKYLQRFEQDSQQHESSGSPRKRNKKKHKIVEEPSEPAVDPNSISVSNAETESGDKND